MKNNKGLKLVFFLFSILSWNSCTHEKLPQYKNAPVILITIDTLRSDRLPAYGFDGISTPHIDSLVRDGILFTHAYCQSPLTLPSHSTLFVGKDPPGHGVRANTGYVLEDQMTLAKVFRDNGYQTGAVVSSMVLRMETGIAQGFDFYDDLLHGTSKKQTHSYAQRKGKDSLEIAKRWLSEHQKEEPFFLWLHLYEPHMPHAAPEPYASQTDSGYLAEILYVDALIGDLFHFLHQNELYQDSIIMLVSDHGEGLNDHGEWEHGLLLYREAIQVPLILKLPNGQFAGTEKTTPVTLYDIFPTLTQLTGLSTKPLPGANLLSSNLPKDRTIYSETIFPELHFGWHRQQSIIHQGIHYIKGADTKIFDLKNDFEEKTELSSTTGIPASVRKAFHSIDFSKASTTEISDEERELLESLGYAGGFAQGGSLKDTNEKEFLEIFQKIASCKQLMNTEHFLGAEQQLTVLLTRFPEMIDARNMLGTALSSQGKFSLAEHVFSETIKKSPNDLSSWVGLIHSRLSLGKNDGVDQLIQKTIKLDPIFAGKLLLPVLTQFEQWDTGKETAERLLTKYGTHFDSFFFLAKYHHEHNDCPQALSFLGKILNQADTIPDQKTRGTLLYLKADCLAKLHRHREAEKTFQAALVEDKTNPKSWRSLALLLFSQNRASEAMLTLQNWLESNPTKTNYILAAEVLNLVGLKKEEHKILELADRLPNP